MSDQQLPSVDDRKIINDQQPVAETDEDKEKRQALKSYSHKGGDDQLSMSVKVHSPFQDYYDGQAFSVSAENATGPFDILPKHHNFISLLNPCDLIVRTVSKGDQKIRISGGIMHVKADRVIVFLDV